MENQLEELFDKLDKLIALIAIQNKSKEEQVNILANLGYTLKEINKYTAIPPKTIDYIISNIKKGKYKIGRRNTKN